MDATKGYDMTSSGKKLTIMIVDDTPMNIQILAELLGDEYTIIFAVNGHEAIERVVSIQPDLILLDVMMPDMDGFQVCRYLKRDEVLAKIPVIFITALESASDESEGLKLGAVDYITKPFNPDLVLLRVRNHLQMKSQRDTLEKRTMELEQALAEIKTLRGLIPICASCKNIRDDAGSWSQLETYIAEHSDAQFSHGICPTCIKKMYPEQYAMMFPEKQNV